MTNKLLQFILCVAFSTSIFAGTYSGGDGTSGDPYQIATAADLIELSNTPADWGAWFIQTADIAFNTDETAVDWNGDGNPDGSGTSGFSPIGISTTNFTGNYDGDEYVIGHLYISRSSSDEIGFFGSTYNATLSNILISDANVTGNELVGVLAGWVGGSTGTTISDCYCQGSVNGLSNIGAFAGYVHKATISTCASYGSATASQDAAGGFTSYFSSGAISNCYSRAEVNAPIWAGGLLAYNGSLNNGGTVTNCYSTGIVYTTAGGAGGLIAANGSAASVSNSFWDTQTSNQGTSQGGGTGKTTLEMTTQSTFTNAGWDFTTTWEMISGVNDEYPALQAITFPEAPTVTTQAVTDITMNTATGNGNITDLGSSNPTQYGVCWSTSHDPTIALETKTEQGTATATGAFTSSIPGLTLNTQYYVRAYAINVAGISYGEEVNFTTLPLFSGGSGTSGDPYQISTINDLQYLSENSGFWSSHFIQTADIDAWETSDWNSNAGFSPIGNETIKFDGSYNGQGYRIDGLFIDRSSTDYIGLFGYLDNNVAISNLAITNADITGQHYTGCLAGAAYADINNCFSSGIVHGGNQIGGLVGKFAHTSSGPTMDNCASIAAVTATNNSARAGGLVGFMEFATVNNCYGRGAVSGTYHVGGMVGTGNSSVVNNSYSTGAVSGTSVGGFMSSRDLGSVNNCFFDYETAGTSTSNGGTAKTTEEMKTESTYTNVGWDFVDENTNGTNDFWDMDALLNNGYPYLSWQIFPPTVTTQAVSSIDATSATGNGNVTELGSSNPSQHGVCWNTTGKPSINNGSKTEEGAVSATGAYTSGITGLEMGTTYYVRAYATNDAGINYGNEVSFTTLGPPTVTTTAASSITVSSASSGGNVTADGGATVSARGVCYGTSTNPSIYGDHTTDGSGTGSFVSSLSSLEAGTLYYVRAYATNTHGIAYGSQTSFTTLEPPTVTTQAVSDITKISATGNGTITDLGSSNPTQYGVCWNTDGDPNINDDNKTEEGEATTTGAFTSGMTGLSRGQTYYVKAYATNSAGTGYGVQVSFTTLADPPTVSTAEIAAIESTTAVSGGEVTDDGGASVSARGVVWNTTGTPTISSYDGITDNGTGVGSYNALLSGLSSSETYYVRSYATNSEGTSYGTEKEFTTLAGGTPDLTEIFATIDGGQLDGDNFGNSVSISGNYAIIGAKDDEGTYTLQGSASIYKFTGGVWTLLKKITASDPAANDYFGCSVAISGDYALVGAYGDNSSRGCVYIFSKNEGGSDNWGQVQKITASDGATSDQYGIAVSLSGNIGIIGAHLEDEDSNGSNTLSMAGSAYIIINSGGTWSEQQKIVASDRAGNDQFGGAVSISGNQAIIGASNKNSQTGAAYTFKNNGSSWTEVQKVVASDAASNNYFGNSVSISGDYAVSGAYGNASNQGAAYVFYKDEGGSENWGQVNKITASDGASNDYFGMSVSISGMNVLVGAKSDDEDENGTNTLNNAGSAYIFNKDEDGENNWGQVQKLVPSNRQASASFGSFIVIAGDNCMISAEGIDNQAGSVYFFENNADITVPVITTTAPSDILVNIATSGGNITSDGGGTVTIRGIVWNTSGNPSLDDNTGSTNDGDGDGSFSSSLTGLEENTTYYVRAYAINGKGISYGDAEEFTTLENTNQTFTVTQTSDDGSGSVSNSLSWAINQANSAGSATHNIVFDLSSKSTVTITAALPAITASVDINSNEDASGVTIQVDVPGTGGSAFRVFDINAPSNAVSLNKLTILGGDLSDIDQDGGGIRIREGTITIDECTISGSKAIAGGGISCSLDAVLTMTNNTVSENTAEEGGGLYSTSGTGAYLTNCTFSSNTTAGGRFGGGGIYSTDIELTNCTFDGNSSSSAFGGFGGGLFSGETVLVKNCTFSNNSAGIGGGLVSMKGGILFSTIVANNTAGFGPDIASGTSSPFPIPKLTSNDYNLVEDITDCVFDGATDHNITGEDPGLGSLADNGGPTQTMSIGRNSNCRDASTNNGAPNTDQRGYEIKGTKDIGAFEYQGATVTWDGSESNDWNTADNWDMTPLEYDDILIPSAKANYPLIQNGESANADDLTVELGATLTINSGGSLITTGSITNNGTINVHQSLTEDDHWHFISVPNNVTTAGALFDGKYLQQWIEGDGTEAGWQDVVDPETSLTPAKGYSLWMDDGAKMGFTYSGTPSTGDQSIAITANGTGTNKWMNFVGNPYPSYLDWDEVSGYGSKYTWNGTAYTSYTEEGSGDGSQYVNPMEGFFIYKNAGVADNFSLTNAMRVHQPSGKSDKKALQNGLVLEASNGSYNDALWIVFEAEAADGFEFTRDAWKIKSGTEGLSQLWSVSTDGKLSIDVRPETETIQLGFANDVAGVYTIGIEEIAAITNAWLEDTKTGKFHKLQNSDYEFAWNPDLDDESRFKLHFNAVGIEENPISESNLLIYAADGNIYIHAGQHAALHGGTQNTYGTVQHAVLAITDMTGRIVMQQEISGTGLISIPVNLKTGVYIVTVRYGNDIKTEKVFIK